MLVKLCRDAAEELILEQRREERRLAKFLRKIDSEQEMAVAQQSDEPPW